MIDASIVIESCQNGSLTFENSPMVSKNTILQKTEALLFHAWIALFFSLGIYQAIF